MDKNVEFNRFKAETMCRLCEIESCINYFAAGMLKRATENGSDNSQNIVDNLYKYSDWLKESVQGYIDRSVENTILTLGLESDFTVN